MGGWERVDGGLGRARAAIRRAHRGCREASSPSARRAHAERRSGEQLTRGLAVGRWERGGVGRGFRSPAEHHNGSDDLRRGRQSRVSEVGRAARKGRMGSQARGDGAHDEPDGRHPRRRGRDGGRRRTSGGQAARQPSGLHSLRAGTRLPAWGAVHGAAGRTGRRHRYDTSSRTGKKGPHGAGVAYDRDAIRARHGTRRRAVGRLSADGESPDAAGRRPAGGLLLTAGRELISSTGWFSAPSQRHKVDLLACCRPATSCARGRTWRLFSACPRRSE